MQRISKEELRKALVEYVEEQKRYNSMLDGLLSGETLEITPDFEKSEIVITGDKVEKLRLKWHSLLQSYLTQREK